MTIVESWLFINAVFVVAILYAMALEALEDWIQARFWKRQSNVVPFRRER